MKLTDTRSNDRAVDKAAQVGIDVHLPLIPGRKETVTVRAATDEEDTIRSRCDKAAQVGIDVHTQKARKLLCNLSITLEDAILRLSPELKVLVRKKRFTGSYGTGDVEVAAHGDREFTGDGGQENDDEAKRSDDDDDITTQAPKE